MPLAYRIDPSRAIVLSRAWGPLPDADVHAFYARLRSDPAFDPAFRHLVDLCEVPRVTASADALGRMARASPFAPGARRAVVVAADLAHGLARMFAAYAELTGGEVAVFRDFGEAEQWLGLG